MKKKTLRLATAMALGLPLAAGVQADPAAPTAPAQALGYQSAFWDYQRWQDIQPGDWRAANDEVRDAAAKSGGHGGHGVAPVAAAAPPTAPRPATPAAPPEPAPQTPATHEGHGGHE